MVDHVGAGLTGCAVFEVLEDGFGEVLGCAVGVGSCNSTTVGHKDEGISDGFATGTILSGSVV